MEKQIGAAIRRIRQAQSMTVQTLAQRAGISKGYLSKLENGLKSPPVSTLSNIADALGVDLADLFERRQPEGRCTLVRREERRKITRDGSSYGYDYEALPFGAKAMESFIITFTNDSNSDHRVSHEGEEMVYVLQGRMRFYHGDEVFDCEEGDCVYFDPSMPHLAASLGEGETKVLMVVAPKRNPR